MRVLVINQYFPPDASSTAHLLGELCEDLARAHDVAVVAGRPSYEATTGATGPLNVRVRRVRSTRFSRRTLPGRAANYLTFVTLATGAAVLARRPDVIVTMTDPPIAGLLGVLASRRHERPFALLSHDVYPDIALAAGVLAPGSAAQVWRLLNRIVRRSAACILTVGRDMSEKLENEGVPKERLLFAPCWSADWGAARMTREQTRASMGWRDRFVVMHAGNQGVAQNLPMLADLAQELREHDDVEIILLGDGAGLSEFKRSIDARGLTNVRCLPHRERADAQRLMAAADLHVVSLIPGLWGCAAPSKTYGILSVGRPFVAAVDSGSEPHRIITEHGCGVRVPAGDHLALAGAILELKEQDLEPLGDRARAAYEGAYTRARATQRIERALAALVSERQLP
jgi:colanic acid biosynthesis glycosyl transferase WcaI